MPHTDQGVPFAPGSHTSWKSAEAQGRNRKRGAKVAALMLAYQAAGSHGVTDPEASRSIGVPVQSICSLRGSLMDQGLVSRGGERIGDYGKNVTVWLWIGD